MSLLGQRVLRTEDPRMLTEGGTYVADVSHPLLDGAASLHFVRSTHRHARIVGIDTADALAMPGVVAAFTAADVDVGPMPPVLPRFDPALWSWLVRFALCCTRPAMLRAGHALAALLNSSRSLYGDLFRRGEVEAEWQQRGWPRRNRQFLQRSHPSYVRRRAGRRFERRCIFR